jgi:hypothetical protein
MKNSTLLFVSYLSSVTSDYRNNAIFFSENDIFTTVKNATNNNITNTVSSKFYD